MTLTIPPPTGPAPGVTTGLTRAGRHELVRRHVAAGLPAPVGTQTRPDSDHRDGAPDLVLILASFEDMRAWAERLDTSGHVHTGPWVGPHHRWRSVVGDLVVRDYLLDARVRTVLQTLDRVITEPHTETSPPSAPRPAAAPAPDPAPASSGRAPGMDPLRRDALIASRHAVRPRPAPTRWADASAAMQRVVATGQLLDERLPGFAAARDEVLATWRGGAPW